MVPNIYAQIAYDSLYSLTKANKSPFYVLWNQISLTQTLRQEIGRDLRNEREQNSSLPKV